MLLCIIIRSITKYLHKRSKYLVFAPRQFRIGAYFTLCLSQSTISKLMLELQLHISLLNIVSSGAKKTT